MDPQSRALSAQVISRRAVLGGIPVVGLLALAACSTSTGKSGSSSATARATAAPTGAPATAGSVAALAQAFQVTLSASLQSTLVHDYTLANAELWSNLPQGLLSQGGGPGGGSAGPRLGITLDSLGASQLAAFTALLKATTGSGSGLGYAEIQQHLNADDYLSANGGGATYGRANFYIAFLGTPAETGTWEFQFGGHHLAVANTYIDGSLAGATPSFRGIEPNGVFTQDGTSNQPMAVKEKAFKALLAGLSADQLVSAKLADTYSDLVLTPGNDWAFPTKYEGVKVSSLTSTQKQLVVTAIGSYVNDVADADAAKILARYQGELADTYVAYSGTTALTEQNDYVRIAGPSVWIESSMQHGIVLAGNHPHSVWRDRTTDYGGTSK